MSSPAENDFLVFAGDSSADVLTTSEYESDTDREIGNQVGIARQQLVNKALRQSSIIASMIGQFIYNNSGNQAVDDGTITDLLADFTTGIETVVNGNNQVLIVVDEKTSGTSGGTFTSGAWRTRDLNTVRHNTIVGASLSSNQITLPAGTYLIEASAPAVYVYINKIRLRNITDGVDAAVGSSAWTGSNDTGAAPSQIIEVITISSGQKVFEIQHYCSSTYATSGFGAASAIAGIAEIYTQVKITKIR